MHRCKRKRLQEVHNVGLSESKGFGFVCSVATKLLSRLDFPTRV